MIILACALCILHAAAMTLPARRSSAAVAEVTMPAQSHPYTPREAVVVLMRECTVGCKLNRLLALAKSSSTEQYSRDVWVLYDKSHPVEDPTMLAQLNSAGIHFEAQPDIPEAGSWHDYGDIDSGLTKPSFIAWAAAKPEYDFFWHLEDDAFYTGKWGELFDAGPSDGPNEDGAKLMTELQQSISVQPKLNPLLTLYSRFLNQARNSTADLVGKYLAESNPSWYWWTNCTVNGIPCLGDNETRLQFLWPIARFSAQFVTEMKSALSREDGAFKGHHEALTPNFCVISPWCTMQQLPNLGVYKAFCSNLMQKEDMSLEYLSKMEAPYEVKHSSVYHPVKCESGDKAAEEAWIYNVGAWSSPPAA